jgi:hypothetical protein
MAMVHTRDPRMAVRLLIAAALLIPMMVVFPGTARACSCALPEPRDAIAEADAAFVGRLLDRSGGNSMFGGDGEATFFFAVDDDVKGNLGTEVEVVSPASGGSCGLEVREGSRVGLFLTLSSSDTWTSSLCSQIDPDVLLRAAAPLPAPDGAGPIRLLVGGNFGEARVMSLDRAGRTLAYGYGTGDVFDIDVCPGGHRSVESVAVGREGAIVVRDVASLAVVRKVPLVEAKFPSIYVVACLDRRGEHLLAIDHVRDEVRVHEIVDDQAKVVFSERGRAWGTAIERGIPYLILRGTRFGRVDIGSGHFHLLARLPSHADWARLSPGGGWVAAVRYGGADSEGSPSDIVLISTVDGSVTTRPLVGWNDGGRLRWLSEDRLLFLPTGEDVDRVAVYDIPSFEEIVGADEWYAGEAVLSDGVLYGTEGSSLTTVELGNDEVARTLRTFDGSSYALALVPGAMEAEPSPIPVTPAPSPVSGPSRPGGLTASSMWWVIALAIAGSMATLFALRSRSRIGGPASDA